MPLWEASADAITNKPKFLTDDANSKYDRTNVYATNQGWVMRAGSAGTGCGNTGAQEEVLVAIGGLAGTSSSTGLELPTITRVRWGEASYTGAVSVTVNVTWDEAVLYTAGTAATLAIVSTGTNITATATHIDNVAIANNLTGATVRFVGTTIDENATLSIADDTVIGDPDLKDALHSTNLDNAGKTITAAVKTAIGYSQITIA